MKFLGEVLALSVKYLKDKGVSAPRLSAEVLLAHVLGKKRVDLYMQFECPLEEEELIAFRLLLKRAALQEPIEYITSQTEFYDCVLNVSDKVLIPRPETEILVDEASKILKKEDLEDKVLFDVCTGSGCIGLSLKKKFPSLSVYLSDVSSEALKVAEGNRVKNELDVTFFEGDFLNPFSGLRADYVFCNPPYVTEEEYEGLDLSVKGFEPKLALVGGKSGLVFYERLARDLPSYVNSGAKIFLELGFAQGEAVKKIFSGPIWKNKRLLSDFAGHDRFFFLEIE